ncbi:MAG: hypothetical protein ABIX01_17025 [Chitinophagaceae bacterium]
MNLQVIIEKGDEVLYGRINGNLLFAPVTAADTTKEVLANLRMLIKDYQQHEGIKDAYWNKINAETIEFEMLYDIQAFFEEHDFLNISAVARHANLNESLVRQYATGKKFPSAEQTKKLQDTIRDLSIPLQKLSLYVEV